MSSNLKCIESSLIARELRRSLFIDIQAHQRLSDAHATTYVDDTTPQYATLLPMLQKIRFALQNSRCYTAEYLDTNNCQLHSHPISIRRFCCWTSWQTKTTDDDRQPVASRRCTASFFSSSKHLRLSFASIQTGTPNAKIPLSETKSYEDKEQWPPFQVKVCGRRKVCREYFNVHAALRFLSLSTPIPCDGSQTTAHISLSLCSLLDAAYQKTPNSQPRSPKPSGSCPDWDTAQRPKLRTGSCSSPKALYSQPKLFYPTSRFSTGKQWVAVRSSSVSQEGGVLL